MAAVTQALAATASTTNTTAYNSSTTFTPATGDLLVVVVVASGAAGTAPTCRASNGLPFTLVLQALKNSSADSLYVFVAERLVGGGGVISVTFTAQASATGAVVDIYRVSGMTRAGSDAIKQSAKVENQAGGGTPAVTPGAAVLTGNPTIVAVANGANPAALTFPTNWTETTDTGYATPATGLETATRDSGFTGTTITWGGTSGTAFSAMAVEMDTTVPRRSNIGGDFTVRQHHRASDLDGTLANNAAMSVNWTDRGTDAAAMSHATAGNQPTFKTGGPNGKSYLDFDGTADHVTSSSTVPQALQQTVVAVVNPTSYAAIHTVVGAVGAGGLQFRTNTSPAGARSLHNQNTAGLDAANTIAGTAGTWQIVIAEWDDPSGSGASGQARHYLDGVMDPTTQAADADNLSGTSTAAIGANRNTGTPAELWLGGIAEVVHDGGSRWSWQQMVSLLSTLSDLYGTPQPPGYLPASTVARSFLFAPRATYSTGALYS